MCGFSPPTAHAWAQSLSDAGTTGPIGLITNAVGGTTLASWSDPADLAACPNSTDTSSAAPPIVLFNGMTAPFVNMTLSGFLWYQ